MVAGLNFIVPINSGTMIAEFSSNVLVKLYTMARQVSSIIPVKFDIMAPAQGMFRDNLVHWAPPELSMYQILLKHQAQHKFNVQRSSGTLGSTSTLNILDLLGGSSSNTG
jgi:hypothetical protein